MRIKKSLSKRNLALCITAASVFSLLSVSVRAGIMLGDIDTQEYRDFAENLGRFRPGVSNIPVYKTDGTLSGYLEFPMPDFGAVITDGWATLINPTMVATVAHNNTTHMAFGNNALYAATYHQIARNAKDGGDFMTPRLSKAVIEAAPVEGVDFKSADKNRYTWYARAGSGTQTKLDTRSGTYISLAGAYQWKSGGTIETNEIASHSDYQFEYQNRGDIYDSLMPIQVQGGDSGSPVLGYDSVTGKWVLVGEAQAVVGNENMDTLQEVGLVEYFYPSNYNQASKNKNSSDVLDKKADGDITWGADAITQGTAGSWAWQGLDAKYKSTAPAQASDDELDATKNLTFAGDGGRIVLADAVNMGAGLLTFAGDYTLTSADGAAATWAGAGVQVDDGNTVSWQVNGLADDSLQKIGAGTLYVNASGVNPGSLGVGDGTVVLAQQADANGNVQAFSSVTLASGRPTVVLQDDKQVATDKIYFGYRGGALDLNGNALTFHKINHTDSGATLVNHNSEKASVLNITGVQESDLPDFRTYGANKGAEYIGDIYQSGGNYYQRIGTGSITSGYPGKGKSNADYKYITDNVDVARQYWVDLLNTLSFRGFIGETDETKINGAMNVTYSPSSDKGVFAFTGGMNLSGDLAVDKGTLLLSGQPVPHAGGVIIDDDWTTSLFAARAINVGKNATLDIGEYAAVKADVNAGESTKIRFGYNDSLGEAGRMLRCTSVINSEKTECAAAHRTQAQLDALPASEVTGNVSLDFGASLYLGKVVYQGAVTSERSNSLMMDGSAVWNMTGNSNVASLQGAEGAHISLVSSGEDWQPKTLTVDSLNATGTTLTLGIDPATARGDELIINQKTTGADNILDAGLMLKQTGTPVLNSDIVMIDAPAGTSHDYFTVPDVSEGFSIYTPLYKVEDKDDRVLWLLKNNKKDDPVPDPDDNAGDNSGDNSADNTGDNSADNTGDNSADNTGDNSTDNTGDNSADNTGDNSADNTGDNSTDNTGDNSTDNTGDNSADNTGDNSADNTGQFNPDDWFSIRNNQALLDQTRRLMMSRQYIISEAVHDMTRRGEALRQPDGQDGAWITYGQMYGGFTGIGMSQQKLNVGWDIHQQDRSAGISAGYTQGHSDASAHETHKLFTLEASYARYTSAGWFMNAGGSYMHLTQTLGTDAALGMQPATQGSDFVYGNLRGGYQFSLMDNTLDIETSAGVGAGYLSGYQIDGPSAGIALSSAAPVYMTAGLKVSKKRLFSAHPDLTLNAGADYQYMPGATGSRLTLSDQHAARKWHALTEKRTYVYAGLEGKLTGNWSAEVSAGTSPRGNLYTDFSAGAGVRYSF